MQVCVFALGFRICLRFFIISCWVIDGEHLLFIAFLLLLFSSQRSMVNKLVNLALTNYSLLALSIRGYSRLFATLIYWLFVLLPNVCTCRRLFTSVKFVNSALKRSIEYIIFSTIVQYKCSIIAVFYMVYRNTVFLIADINHCLIWKATKNEGDSDTTD